jgi:hypothetical protein
MPTGPLTNFPNGLSAGGVEINGGISAAGVIAGATLAGLKLVTQTLTATGVVNAATRVLFLQHNSTIIAATLADPAEGDLLIVVNTSASGTAAHTVTLPNATWNGTHKIATLNAPDEMLICIASSATRYRVLVNLGSVGFS